MSVITVTPAAAAKASELLAESKSPSDALRVRVINGGCNGMRYELVFDGEVGESDDESVQHGLRVLVDAESAQYLEETTVDFQDGLNDAGFKISNPTADGTCGCGESFNI